MHVRPELLAPAGQWDALTAAVCNGADAVYLGGKTLNARRGAGNFDGEELKRAADYLHERGKKLYVTVNTVVKQEELGELEKLARELAAAQADAAIVQDFGVALLLGQMLPNLKLHASTQMAVNNVQGVRYLKSRGFDRVVPAREMSLEEIRESVNQGIEIEVFCHGALCVACSGQCLFSSLVGGRSGNRGACAQPCRLPYRLNGGGRAEGYLLSPKDLMTAGYLEELCDTGIASLKIEGRLKRPEYVATVTRIYRRLLDGDKFTPEDEEALKQIFNRGGFTEGYPKGIRDGTFLSIKRPSHMGVRVAQAVSAGQIRLEKDVLKEDALALRPANGEELPLQLEGMAGRSIANPTGKTGEIFRMNSERQLRLARESCEREYRYVPLKAELTLKVGCPAVLALSDGTLTVTRTGDTVEACKSGSLNRKRALQQLAKTGGTIYTIEEAELIGDENAFAAVSVINALRRECIEELSRARIDQNATKHGHVISAPSVEERTHTRARPRIAVQAADTQVLRACLAAGADEAVYFPADVRPEALEDIDIGGMYLYIPPVLSSASLETVNRFALKNREAIRGVYLTNIGQLSQDWPGEKRYDFTLNTASAPAMRYLGITENTVYTPSVELTVREIRQFGGTRELIVYGRLPLMHLRHCPLNASRGGGRHTDCRACDTAAEGKRLADCILTDRKNAIFPLRRLATDEGCVIDVMNSVPLNLGGHMDELPECDGWRMIFDAETPKEAARLVNAYRRRADGIRQEEIPCEGPLTTGHYFRKTE